MRGFDRHPDARQLGLVLGLALCNLLRFGGLGAGGLRGRGARGRGGLRLHEDVFLVGVRLKGRRAMAEEKAEAAKKKAEEEQKKLEEKRAKLREDTDRYAADQKKAGTETPVESQPVPEVPPVPEDYLDIPADPNALPTPPKGY